VVGYCAVAIYRTGSEAPQSEAKAKETEGNEGASEFTLGPGQKRYLLNIARGTLGHYIRGGRIPKLKTKRTDPLWHRPGAAFVTLRKQGELRGCMGTLVPEEPLSKTVQRMTIRAATQDPRFPPVRPEEIPQIEIEVSVLSPLRKVAGAEEIELGKHGVVVESHGRRGVFLPQVAEETGWTKEEFLTHLCRDKAGLAPDAWRQGADLYVFTVQAITSPAPRPSGIRAGAEADETK
jgi:AmmeMemoRadiSam system protein A